MSERELSRAEVGVRAAGSWESWAEDMASTRWTHAAAVAAVSIVCILGVVGPKVPTADACPAPSGAGSAALGATADTPSVSYMMEQSQYAMKAKVLRIGSVIDSGSSCDFIQSDRIRSFSASTFAAEVELSCLFSGDLPPLPERLLDVPEGAPSLTKTVVPTLTTKAPIIIINGLGKPGCAATDIAVGEYYLFFVNGGAHDVFGDGCMLPLFDAHHATSTSPAAIKMRADADECAVGRGCSIPGDAKSNTPKVIVPHLWTGKGDACNQCSCSDGSLSCTKMMCGGGMPSKGDIKVSKPQQSCMPHGDCCFQLGREEAFWYALRSRFLPLVFV